jgi:hypothetical protein
MQSLPLAVSDMNRYEIRVAKDIEEAGPSADATE